jgi:oligopeptide transport system ATP-binding protein
MNAPLLEVESLSVSLPTPEGRVNILEDVSFSVREGHVHGLAGESGSGKTMSVLALMRLLPRGAVVSGRAIFRGRDLLALDQRALRDVRGRELAMVFQDPMTSLHPMLTVGHSLTEHLRHHLGLRRPAARREAIAMLEAVRISGGMRQRIAIAVALICNPTLLIADEPTTALDVTVQAGVLTLLDSLRRERGLSMIIITHDLGVMSSIAESVSVMYSGRIVESGPTSQLLTRPRHPYAHGLLQSLPHPESTGDSPLRVIRGAPPRVGEQPDGCPFHPRCSYVQQSCRERRPPLTILDGGRRSACDVDPLVEYGA